MRTEEDLEADGTVRGIKKIRDLGVFTVTSIFSILAYVWLYVVLDDGFVRLYEAIITFSAFWIVMLIAYVTDRINAKRTKARMQEKLGELGAAKVDEEGEDG